MEAILNDLSYFSSLYPRLEGSRGEKAAYFYIRDYLVENDIPYLAKLNNPFSMACLKN